MKKLGFNVNVESMNEISKSFRSGRNWFRIPNGTSVLRILPPWSEKGLVALPVYYHNIELKRDTFTRWNWCCMSKTFGKPCPICDALEKVRESGVSTNEYEANTRIFYANAIVMNDPTYKNGEGTKPGTHVIVKLPYSVYTWIINQITNPMVGDITSIENGIDIFITREGQGLSTRYSCTFSPNGRTPVPSDILENIDDLYNIDEIFENDYMEEDIKNLTDKLNNLATLLKSTDGNFDPAALGQVAQVAPVTPSGLAPASNPVQGGLAGFAPVVPATPVAQPLADLQVKETPVGNPGNKPCFGQYNETSVECIMCPVELQCRSKG